MVQYFYQMHLLMVVTVPFYLVLQKLQSLLIKLILLYVMVEVMNTKVLFMMQVIQRVLMIL